MKILFICDWDFTELWHLVAEEIQKKDNTIECDALVVGKIWYEKLKEKPNPFLSSYLLQDYVEHVSDIDTPNFEEALLIEKKYAKSTLWHFLWCDRSWIYESYPRGLARINKCVKFFEKFYGTNKYDLIVTNNYGSLPHVISFSVANKIGIPVLNFVPARFGSLNLPCYDMCLELTHLKKEFKNGKVTKKIRQKAEILLVEFRENQKKPLYEVINKKAEAIDFFIVFRAVRYFYRFYISKTYAGEHSKKNPFDRTFKIIQAQIKKLMVLKLINWAKPDKTVPFIYFPLHLQPEASTMTAAPFYINQFSIIENISKSIPYGMKVLVKEHPLMVGRRSIDYYRELQKIANVDVVGPETNNFELIRNASLIMTITGTTAIEALMLKKPVITLGDVFFNHCSLVHRWKNKPPTKWTSGFKKILSTHQHNEEELLKFLSIIVKHGDDYMVKEPNSAGDHVLNEQNINKLSAVVLHQLSVVK